MKMEAIYGSSSSPYYIYVPRWIDSSAGIRALHFLCHSLNKAGESAYLVLTENNHASSPRINGLLHTPILTKEQAIAHYRASKTPIVIYSETVKGNPINAPVVVRYLLNYAGALGGSMEFEDSEMLVAFSENIAKHYQNNIKDIQISKLFLPPVDPREIVFQIDGKSKNYLVYAGKYRAFVGQTPEIQREPVIEIFRDGTKRQNRNTVLKLLRESKALITFENSSLATEAVLSGTPAIFIPNQFLTEVIAEKELGWFGSSWGLSEEDEENARATVALGREIYFERVNDFEGQLASFIIESQSRTAKAEYKQIISLPKTSFIVSGHRISLAFQILKSRGLSTLIRIVINFLRRRLPNRADK